MTVTSELILKENNCTDDFLKSVLHVSQVPHRLCTTCKISINKKRIPKMALTNGFDFPIVPEELKDLSPLEERLVALRIPFMQIRLLGSERQSSLKGNVVNVENDLDVCAQVLPRKFNEVSTVQVKLMRRMSYKSPNMYETIRPQKVYTAAKYLINSELYKSEGVVLSEDWSLYTNDETLDFICVEENRTSEQEESLVEEGNTNDDETPISENLGAEETLIYHENDESILGIKIAPGEGKIPIPIHRDLKAEVLSFPSIYCGFDRRFREGIKISYTDIAKSELRRYDRRACNPTHILYAFKKSFNEKVNQAVQICMRKKVGRTNITAISARAPGFINNLLKKDEGYAVFKNLRSSPSYWKEKTKKVIAMVRQLGKCAFFITLSAAETKWPELLVMLAKIVHKRDITIEEAEILSYEDKADLIRSDPVTCMRHFDHRLRALMNLLFKSEGGIFAPYKLEDYFLRFEYQLRGSPHVHGLYWIKDSPDFVEGDFVSLKACTEFIDKYITCERYEDGEMTNLIGYQLHKHSHTCLKKIKKGEKCRFGFPKPPMESTSILTPLPKDYDPNLRKKASDLFAKIQEHLNSMGRTFKEIINFKEYLNSLNTNDEDYLIAIRSSIKRTTVFLKRPTNAIFINAYNRKLLEAWRANIDIQFVVDTYACARYCVGYILKSEGGVSRLLQAAAANARRGNTSIEGKLKKFANILINGSEISAQEAVSFLLSMPNTLCSRQDVFINTAHPDDRIGFLKTQGELDKLNEDSEDICVKGLIDHYSKRPKKMEHVCLAEFASLYEFSKAKSNNLPDHEETQHFDGEPEESMLPQYETSGSKELELLDGSGRLRKRTTRKIIRYRHYGKISDIANYYREQLMLYVPWRDETSELLDISAIEKAEIHNDLIQLNSKPFHKNLDIDYESLLNEVDNNIETQNACPEEFMEEEMIHLDCYSENEIQGNAVNISTRAEQFLPPKFIDETEYRKIMQSLNEKQRRFVLNEIHLLKTSEKPFYHFLSGGAGVGKSHVITAVVQSYLRYNAKKPKLNPDDICVLVSAPTGKAAFNVFGMTLHCTFKLPPTQGIVCNLDDGAVNTLRLKMAKAKLFIIDEVSMVSCKQLYAIDLRLRQIFNSSQDFGGRSIIVVGHLRQLPPVAATYVFEKPTHLARGECVGNYLWEKFMLYELDEIMRQKGDHEFCKALNNMSEGCMEQEDISLIKSREVNQLNEPPINAIRLFRTNEECQCYNSEVHRTLNTEGALSTAFDKIQGSGTEVQKENLKQSAVNLTTQQSDGLPYKTHLQVGGEYFVSTNIDVQDGLFNGATGCLKMIEYGTCNGNKVPARAWMDFRNPLIGVTKRTIAKNYQRKKKINPEWVPIDFITRNLNKGRNKGLEIIRRQIPLVAANGMTIAKAQGSSLPHVVVNVKRFHGRKLTRENLYVACSRATSCKGLFIDGEFEPPNSPAIDDKVSDAMERLRQKPLDFTLKFLQDIDDKFVKLYYHNAQSFHLHFADVTSDQCAMASDILAIVEPHILCSDTLSVPNYDCVSRTNSRGKRNSEGALVFAKQGLCLDLNNVFTSPTDFRPGHYILTQLSYTNITIILVYKSPECSIVAFLKKLKESIEKITGNLLIIGDINMNLQNAKGFPFIDLMNQFRLSSKLKLEDASTDGGTHIDCCFSNAENLKAWFYESYYSYHKAICVVWTK